MKLYRPTKYIDKPFTFRSNHAIADNAQPLVKEPLVKELPYRSNCRIATATRA